MTKNSDVTQLEDVFDELVASEQLPSGAVLDRWIRRYPQFEQELIDFVASWSLMDSAAAPALPSTDATHTTLVLRGMSIVQNLLHDRPRASEPRATLDGLLSTARAAGTTLVELAALTHLGEVVLRKLDRRLIRFSSIPDEAMSGVAAALRASVEAVSSYLQGPRSFATNTHYHASQTPALTQEEDFAAAVRNDPTMTEADRARWLSIGRVH
jgi:hypothetical protein